MKILIVEDDVTSRLLLTAALQQLEHQTVAVVNGREAWDAYRSEPYHLIISDWMMPELDGLELCRLVRAEASRPHAYTYFILLTVLEGKQSYLDGMNAGADDFITKPFDLDQLASRLRVAERILGLQSHVKRLEGLLPICSYCKKIRDDSDTWVNIERYVAERSDALFSHGICQECYQSKVVPELEWLKTLRGNLARS